jgi:nucleotide-binding universal stress UspA family protein
VRVARSRRPADEIVARAVGGDLVVVGTHARQGPARAWLGSVAEKVVRTSPVPTLVTRTASARAAEERVLVAVDAYEQGERLVDEAGRWAARLGARADLAYVISPLVTVDPSLLPYAAGWEPAFLELERSARERLTALLAALPDELRGVPRVGRGEPAVVVADWSAEYPLVVVGSHQRRGLERFWLGSVAERIVRRSTSPVLVLPNVSAALPPG